MASRPGYLAIQWIAIPYIDDHRGANYATKRARMRGFPLPPPADDEGVFHEVRCDFRLGLAPTSVTHAFEARNEGELIRVGGFRLTSPEDNLAFLGPNPWSSKPAFVVRHNTWGRVLWTEKQFNFEHKWLIEHIVNAGRFDAPPKRGIFRGLPTVERDLRRDFLRTGYVART